MKIKKILAALIASVTFCAAVATPVFAEEASKYEKGDVNMDGKITPLDAQLAQEDFLMYVVLEKDHTLTEEQLVLADVTDITPGVTGLDAQFILIIACLRMMGFEDATFENMHDYAHCIG
jgi:hypothetical protein